MLFNFNLRKTRKSRNIIEKCVYTGIITLAILQVLLLYYFYLLHIQSNEVPIYFSNPGVLENYEEFQFDRVNWTLQMKHGSAYDMSNPMIESLRKGQLNRCTDKLVYHNHRHLLLLLLLLLPPPPPRTRTRTRTTNK